MSADLMNAPASDPTDVAAEFRRLEEWWFRETGHLSNLDYAYRHPAYQAVIALGPPVVPILLRELRTKPHWWFEALAEITGEDPMRPEDAGRFDQIAGRWLDWGRAHGYTT
jgi:hypothetical protein